MDQPDRYRGSVGKLFKVHPAVLCTTPEEEYFRSQTAELARWKITRSLLSVTFFLIRFMTKSTTSSFIAGLVACGGSPDPTARYPRLVDAHLHMKSRLSNCLQHLAQSSHREL